LEIGRPHIEDLLNARAGIEERENERVIATTTGGGAILVDVRDRRQHGVSLRTISASWTSHHYPLRRFSKLIQ
jgi:hypothetical protein